MENAIVYEFGKVLVLILSCVRLFARLVEAYVGRALSAPYRSTSQCHFVVRRSPLYYGWESYNISCTDLSPFCQKLWLSDIPFFLKIHEHFLSGVVQKSEQPRRWWWRSPQLIKLFASLVAFYGSLLSLKKGHMRLITWWVDNFTSKHLSLRTVHYIVKVF